MKNKSSCLGHKHNSGFTLIEIGVFIAIASLVVLFVMRDIVAPGQGKAQCR